MIVLGYLANEDRFIVTPVWYNQPASSTCGQVSKAAMLQHLLEISA